jgi:hypothetical protein
MIIHKSFQQWTPTTRAHSCSHRDGEYCLNRTQKLSSHLTGNLRPVSRDIVRTEGRQQEWDSHKDELRNECHTDHIGCEVITAVTVSVVMPCSLHRRVGKLTFTQIAQRKKNTLLEIHFIAEGNARKIHGECSAGEQVRLLNSDAQRVSVDLHNTETLRSAF